MTTTTMEMLDRDPSRPLLDKQLLTRCIDTCLECAQACTACADSDQGEEAIATLVRCVRLNLDCADVCETTARVLTRQTGYDRDLSRSVVQACAQACKVCGDECDRHAAMHEHCRVCAEVCRRCQQVCEEVLVAIG
jgi:hypothetical protein